MTDQHAPCRWAPAQPDATHAVRRRDPDSTQVGAAPAGKSTSPRTSMPLAPGTTREAEEWLDVNGT